MTDRERIAIVLDEARELMKDGHWCKGRNENHGSYCVRGAIAKAATGKPYGKSSLVKATYEWLARFVPKEGIAFFNDQAASWADVDALLAKAAKEARA